MYRGGCARAGGCLLLLLSVAATDAHQDVPTPENVDDDVIYQGDNNVIESGPGIMSSNPQTLIGLADRSPDLLLERLIQADLREDPNFYRSTWDAPYPVLLQKRVAGFLNLKLKESKSPATLNGKRISRPRDRPQPKWKIKKGRVSSGVVCYFKLCAFRST